MREQAIRTFATLHQNFTHKGVADTVGHIADAKGAFGITDVLHAKANSVEVGSTSRSRVVLGESEKRVPIAVFIKQDGRIGTALKCTTRCQKWIANRFRREKA